MPDKNKNAPSSRPRLTQKRAVTIKDLAAALNLSIATISRALNGYPDIGEKTRARVVAAAKEAGYRPNRNAQRLVTQRTRNIGWIQSDSARKFVDPHFSEILAGVLRATRRHQYDVVMTSDSPENQLDVYDRYIKDNSVDGFLVDLPQSGDKRIAMLRENKSRFVVHGRYDGPKGYSWVDIDNFGIIKSAIELLYANGHRKFAFVNGDEIFRYASERHAGALAGLESVGLGAENLIIVNSQHPMGRSSNALTFAALEDSSVTALLYSSATMLANSGAALKDRGRVISENLSVVSVDDCLAHIDLAPFSDKVTFLRSSLQEAGQALIEVLMRQIEHGEEAVEVFMPTVFHTERGLDVSGLAPELLG